MTLGDKLREIRKQAGFSQEQLADKLGVSRQAVTKWETHAGIPDIENIIAISTLFDISIDDLLSNKRNEKKISDYLFESVTEYDIAEMKRFDMNFGGLKQISLIGYDGEKIRIRLASNTLTSLQNDFKVKLDDTRKRIDVDVFHLNGLTDATTKEEVSAFVQIPSPYIGKIECDVIAEEVEVCSLDCDRVELDIKSPNLTLRDVKGAVEVNCNLDMGITCHSLDGYLAINQLSATSRLMLANGIEFTAVSKGVKTGITFEKDGKPVERFDVQDSDNIVELNGIKSELIISTI